MQSRGTHSTGVAIVGKKGVFTHKLAMPAEKFINTDAFKNMLNMNPNIIVGHTRAATVGEKTDENAHPFKFGNIIGVHNGSVTNHATVYPEAKVDSEAIFYTLDKYANDYAKAFKELRGAFAITWIDLLKPNKLFMASDGGRPLRLVKINEIDTYFWASTEDALKVVLGGMFDLSKATIWEPKRDHAYILDTQFQINKKPIEFSTYSSAYSTHKPPASISRSDAVVIDCDDEDGYDATHDYNGLGSRDTDGYRNYMYRNTPDLFVSNLEKAKLLTSNSESVEAKISTERLSMIANHAEIMNFDMPTMQLIVHKVLQQGCELCNKVLDFETETGIYFLKLDKSIICKKCQIDLEEPLHNLIWIDNDEYKWIYDEVVDNEFVTHEEEMALNSDPYYRRIGGV